MHLLMAQIKILLAPGLQLPKKKKQTIKGPPANSPPTPKSAGETWYLGHAKQQNITKYTPKYAVPTTLHWAVILPSLFLF